MSFNPEKMTNIILNECISIEERCDGYREKLVKTIVAILELEKEHSIQGISIRQEINKVCKKSGNFLADKRGTTETTLEDAK